MTKSASQFVVIGGYGAIVMLMLLLGLISIVLISNRTADIDNIIADNNRKQHLIVEMRRASRERTVSLQKMVILSDPFSRDEELQAFWQHASDFISARDELRKKLDSPEERALFDEAMRLVRINAERQNRIAAQIMDGNAADAKQALASEIIPRQVAVFGTLTKLLDFQAQAGASAVTLARETFQKTLIILSLLSGLTLIVSWFIAYMVTRKIDRTERSLAEERERAHITLHSIGDAVLTTDQHGLIDQMNNIAELLTGYRNEEVRGRRPEAIIPLVHEFSSEPIADPVTRVLSGEGIVGSCGNAVLFGKNGDKFAVEFTAAPITDTCRNIKGAILVFRDVTEMRSLSRELAYRARHDSLTGLHNRLELEGELANTLVKIRRSADHQAWLCCLDLDQFKVINDTCGHAAGDELIKQIATILQQRLRSTDFISRLGGDEFALILRDCDEASAVALVGEIHAGINSLRFSWHNKSFSASASFGLVHIRADSGKVQDLLSAADAACYVAKEQGRNRIHIHRVDDNLTTRQNNEMEMVHRINHAVDNDRFELFYQPIEPLSRTDTLTRYEILLRMQTDAQELVLPGAFIPAAERYNLMSRIDRWVVRSVLQTEILAKTGGCSVSINISAQSLSEDSFLGFVLDELARSRIPATSVCFEITETTAISNLTTAVSFIQAVKSRGCLISLDDFGSGLCSFAYLKQLPVDFIKIDGSFVKDLFKDPMNVAMIQSIVNIAKVIDVMTIAEYVCTPEIFDKLRELGVDYVQGYSICEPLPLAGLKSRRVALSS